MSRWASAAATGWLASANLSRQEIGDLAGTTIETAIRVMSRWQKENVVETDKTGFLIRDAGALRDFAPEE